jgi:GNAT superfamily N-acetyltransferase
MKPLTNNLTDRIMYALENQTETFFLDTKEGDLVSLEKNPEKLPDQDPSRYWPLPVWRPSDGFQLMKHFVDHLNNPVYKPRLLEVLSSGQGVFRKFKNILRENRELDRKWLLFKEGEFRKVVTDWHTRYTDAAGSLSRLSPWPDEEPEPDLILTDLTVETETGENLTLLAEWDKKGLGESFPGWNPALAEWWISRFRSSAMMMSVPGEVILTARDPSGQPAGFVWMVPYSDDKRLLVQQIFVLPEFRSLGLGRLLLKRAVNLCRERSCPGPDLLIGPGASFLKDVLDRENWSGLVIQMTIPEN